MSFILDALKKSETDRQQHGPAEFAGVPTSNGRQPTPRWLWVLGILLAVNLAVLLGLLLRPDLPARPVAAVPATADNDDFAERVAIARQNAPARDETPTPAAQATPPATSPVVRESPAPEQTATMRTTPPASQAASASTSSLPTIHEVVAEGMVTLPPLHVDIHVYGESPKDRFVFINMNKHTEGSILAEGPIVEEITTDGVILRYNGISFLLPRD